LILPTKPTASREDERNLIKTKAALCEEKVSEAPAQDSAVKAALAIVEGEIAAEVSFEKGEAGRETEADGFSVYFEFTRQSVLFRTSLARYPSDEAGAIAPFPSRGRRVVWIEGKKGSDLLFIIPELKDCAVQAIAVCPRTYVPRGTLATTKYVPSGARFFVSTKTDGLFGLGSSDKGRVQASLLASSNVPLPEKWFSTDTASTPAATFKFSNILAEQRSPHPFTPGKIPLLGAAESRLDFGTEQSSLRTIAHRASLEVTQFDLPAGDRTVVRGAQLNIEPGACFLVTRWVEKYR
jgi:hypothetical protein